MKRKYGERLRNLAPAVVGLKDHFPRGSEYQGRSAEAICYDDPEYIMYVSLEGLYTFSEEVIELAQSRLRARRGDRDVSEAHIRQRGDY